MSGLTNESATKAKDKRRAALADLLGQLRCHRLHRRGWVWNREELHERDGDAEHRRGHGEQS